MIDFKTLLLARSDVAELLKVDECIQAVESAFRQYASGAVVAPKVLGVHVPGGGFHIKAGAMELGRHYFVAKSNGNFPANQRNYQLPTIQGVVIVCDASNGRVLAVMDSMEITTIRTGAATGVAAKYLSRSNSRTLTICGCGNQGAISLSALLHVRDIAKVYVYDIDFVRAQQFALEQSTIHSIEIFPVDDLMSATKQSDMIVTCTTSHEPFLFKEHIRPGTFIAAVGTDNEDKCEIHHGLLKSSKVVTDVTEQCVHIGDLHHAVKAGQMTAGDVHAEIGQVIAGLRSGRENDLETIVFDSTGTALQDVAAAAIVFEKALKQSPISIFNFAE